MKLIEYRLSTNLNILANLLVGLGLGVFLLHGRLVREACFAPCLGSDTPLQLSVTLLIVGFSLLIVNMFLFSGKLKKMTDKMR